MHLNIFSPQYFIDKSEAKFGVIGITESRLNKDITPQNKINLQNYNI